MDAPADSGALDANRHLTFLQTFSLLDVVETRLGFCNPQVVGWVCEDPNIGFRDGGYC